MKSLVWAGYTRSNDDGSWADRAFSALQLELSESLWVWCLLIALATFLFQLSIDLYLNRIARRAIPHTSNCEKPSSANFQEADQRRLLRVGDGLSILQLGVGVVAMWLFPSFPTSAFPWIADRDLLLIQLIVLASLLAMVIVVLEILPWWHRTVARLRLRSYIVFFLSTIVTLSVLLFLMLAPDSMRDARNTVLAALMFCGGLTFQRGLRQRLRGGDRWQMGLWGSAVISIQFVSMLCVAASVLTGLIVGGRLGYLVLVSSNTINYVTSLFGRSATNRYLTTERHWMSFGLRAFALILSTLAFAYLVLYIVRRLMVARGFWWIDAPNARVMGPHVKYNLYTWLGFDFSLADVVRQAYLKAMVKPGDSAMFEAALEKVAQVQSPRNNSHGPVRFLIIGDPGEGDTSQLYPGTKPNGPAKRQLIESAVTAKSDSVAKQDHTDSGEDNPDFILICTDVIYPAGELIDYERAFYRPYATLNVPFYAIPGNHDWYDHLRGFFANFVYPAAHSLQGDTLGQMPWALSPWRWLAWQQVRDWREDYCLDQIGGVQGNTNTHQRLSFFEMTFDDIPLTVFALDNGVTGSMDRVQYEWLERRLAVLRDKQQPNFNAYHHILVLVGIPLYVDGAFSGAKDAPKLQRPAKDSCSMRKMYELLRKYRVDVVMGGDTHAYQRYTVKYEYEVGNEPRTMHHIVNGGGGAYLSPPIDRQLVDLECSPGGLKLGTDTVYRTADKRYDDVTLAALSRPDGATPSFSYPTAREMTEKFDTKVMDTYKLPERTKQSSYQSLKALWDFRDVAQQHFQCWFSKLALSTHFTSALDHDREPLYQSYVEVTIEQKADRYLLIFTVYDANQEEIDRLELDAGPVIRDA